jgi:hypothetical protein
MFKRSLVYPILLLAALILLPVQAFAGISISSAGKGKFTLQGTQLEEVTSFQLWITYDNGKLSNPRVTMGPLFSSKLAAINFKANPIQIAVVDTNPIGSSGSNCTIATIDFDTVGASTGYTPVLKYLLIPQPTDPNANSGNPSSLTDSSTGSGSGSGSGNITTNTGTGAGIGQVGGTLTFPGDTATKETPKENKDTGAQTAPQDNPEHKPAPAEMPPPPPPEAETKPSKPEVQPAPVPAKPIQSVIERFRLFTGERTVKNLTALFSRESGETFSQSPAIAIADGKATVKLTITKVAGDRAPNFAFNSAHYVSLTRFDDGEWEVEVRPDAGAVSASVTMLLNGSLQEFPLTVTPKAEVSLIKAGEVSEADFLLFLKDSGTPSAPKYDLNGDGKRDYLDDYIYTANYLVRLGEKTRKKP